MNQHSPKTLTTKCVARNKNLNTHPTMITPKKTTIWLAALSIVVLGLCWKAYHDYREHQVLRSFVHALTAQAEVIEQCRDNGLHGATPSVTATCLKYAIEFQMPDWSVGSKYFASAPQVTQYYTAQLQRMVARERTAAIKDLIAHLRATTGQDLGDDPQKWIKEFANKEYQRPRAKQGTL